MSQGNQIAERVAEIQSTIVLPNGYPSESIQVAEAYQPSDISSAVCPFFINEARGGVSQFLATGGLQFVETLIIMHLCIQRRESNLNLRDALQVTLSWRDVVFAAFAQHLRLSSSTGTYLDFILDASIVNWQLEEFVYGTTSYVSIRYDLRVREAFPLLISV